MANRPTASPTRKRQASSKKRSAAPQRTAPTQADIAKHAYELYEQSGRPAGRDEEFWLQAEAQLAAALQLK